MHYWHCGRAAGGSLRKVMLICLTFLLLVGLSPVGQAATQWGDVVDRIEQTMDKSVEVYKTGNLEGAKKIVNDAYYGIYEKDGFEMAVRNTVSSKRANLSEYEFGRVKKMMNEQASPAEIEQQIDEMIAMMREDVDTMKGHGGGEGAWTVFWPAFVILVREGLEAILVIGAIIAYLVKSGNEQKVQVVYRYSLAALLASFLTAILFRTLLSASGASQEVLEGSTMLLAVVVLLSVSQWMSGKANQKAWSHYIEGKVQASLSEGNTLALGLAAFLAVYREGAEVVLFYQALFNNAGDDMHMIWLGFGAGCVALVFIYALVRYGSVRIPLKPFFIGTSVLMSCLAVTFAGGGVKELQEGGVIGLTPMEGIPSIDLLGLYPTLETLAAQLFLILAIAGMTFYQKRKNHREVVQ